MVSSGGGCPDATPVRWAGMRFRLPVSCRSASVHVEMPTVSTPSRRRVHPFGVLTGATLPKTPVRWTRPFQQTMTSGSKPRAQAAGYAAPSTHCAWVRMRAATIWHETGLGIGHGVWCDVYGDIDEASAGCSGVEESATAHVLVTLWDA